MNKLTTICSALLFSLVAHVSFSQSYTPLLAGYRFSDEIDVVDTTGLTFTVVSTIDVTSDFGSVFGIYGLSLHPITDEMYVCYQSSGGAGGRRLGTIDTETGSITDIGNCGNIVDMDFGPDGTLYGSTGNFSADFSFVQIDIATGAQSFILDYTPSSYGGGMAYDQFNDRMYYQNNNGTSFIDLGTFVETVGSPVGSLGETQAMVILTPTLGWMARYGTLYTFNPTTEVYSSGPSIDSYHSFGFAQQPCIPIEITASATEACEGVAFTLTGDAPGTITWDGGVVDATPFVPGVPGTYTYTASSDDEDVCTEGNSIDVTVVGLPIVVAGAGDLEFCEGETIVLSVGGDADEYEWNDGDELNLTPSPGTYTFTVVGAYTEGGCIGGESTSSVDVTVVGLPTITASASPSTICDGTMTTVSGSGGVSYEWNDGIEDGSPFAIDGTGTYEYSVVGTDANGCSSTASVSVEVVEGIDLSGAVTLAIEDDGEIDLTATGGVPPYTYDWDNDGTGDFDDDEDLTGLPIGSYTVVVRSNGGCESTATYIVDSQLGLEEMAAAGISVYPNPVVETVTIQAEGNFQYELTTINGKVLFTGTAVDQEQFSMQEFARGTYLMTVRSNDTATTMKLIKE